MTLPRPGPSFPAVPGVCFSPGRMLFCRLPRTADYTAPCTPILKRNGRTLPEEGRYAASPVRAHGRASARRSGSGRRHRLTTFFTNCLCEPVWRTSIQPSLFSRRIASCAFIGIRSTSEQFDYTSICTYCKYVFIFFFQKPTGAAHFQRRSCKRGDWGGFVIRLT